MSLLRREGRQESAPDTAPLLTALRAGDPEVVRALWVRYAPLVLRVLHCALKDRSRVDEAAKDVFRELLRWGPDLPAGAELKLFVVRAVSRTVERLSPPPRAEWDPNKSAKTIRGRAKLPPRDM